MREVYYVRDWGNGIKSFAKIVGVDAYSYDKEKKEWVPNQDMIKIQFDMTDYDEISKDEFEKMVKSL